MSLRDELTGKHFSLSKRLRLFDATVSATMLYGAAALTFKKDLQSRIQRTQRKMLRMMMRYGRKFLYENGEPDVEPWVEWVQRVTHKAEHCMENVGMRGWVDAHWHLKQKWYNELLSNDRHTWAHWSFNWCPPGQRAQGRPKKRWTDDIKNN